MGEIEFKKIETVLEFLIEKLLGYDNISGDVYNMIFERNFTGEDIINFIRYANEKIERGLTPNFDEWFNTIKVEKTGAPSPNKGRRN